MTDSEESSVWSDNPEEADEDDDQNGHQRHLRKQMEEEIARRVADALPETPPMERMRRRQDAARQQNIAMAEEMNAQLDFSEDHYYRDQTEKIKSEIRGRLMDLEPWRRKQRPGEEEPMEEEEEESDFIREINRQFKLFEPIKKFSIQKYYNTSENVPLDSNSVAPLLPHPRLLQLIHSEPEPLYTAIKYVLGSRTYENQVTPYTHRIRGSGIVYDSVKSPKEQKTLQPSNPLIAPNLVFESRFECGNLRRARRVGQFEYELVLNTDMFTRRHTQWYYFRIQNMVPGIIYKFRIVNLLKKDSLYNHGMRPLFYSEIDAHSNKKGWVRHGHHISYGRNVLHLLCPLLSREIPYYELEWQMEFPHGSDTCYMAHCYPFSYSDLLQDIRGVVSDTRRSRYVQHETLCQSRAGHDCPILTITNFEKTHCNKKCVFVSARVHPGESNSSWMMQGLYDFLTSNDLEAKELRDRFIFKIVPMINIDGVIVGNYRCSLQARDLNRNYRWPKKDKFPIIWHIKQLIEDIQQNHGVFVYCDFHGHSRKSNVFMYGNSTTEMNGNKIANVKDFLGERMLPFLISKLVGQNPKGDPDMFSFELSRFSIRRCKESTGRVVMFRQHGIINSFTMEATFSGTRQDKEGSRHYNQRDFMDAGVLFCRGVLEFSRCLDDENKESEAFIALSQEIAQWAACKSLGRRIGNSLSTGPLINPDADVRDTDMQGDGEVTTNTWPVEQRGSGLDAAGSAASVEYRSHSNGRGKDGEASGSDQPVQGLGGSPTRPLRTIKDCFSLLENLSLSQADLESESSDSDSESEPEMKPDKHQGKKKKKKKHKKSKDAKNDSPPKDSATVRNESKNTASKKAAKSVDVSSRRGKAGTSPPNDVVKYSIEDNPNFNPFKVLPNINSEESHIIPRFAGKKPKSDRRHTLNIPGAILHNGKMAAGWSNPYQHRSNGGIPCFSEERSLERAAKRMAEIQKKVEESVKRQQKSKFISDDLANEYSADFDLDLQELNALRLQKRHVQESFNKSIRMLAQSCLPNIVKKEEEKSVKQQRRDESDSTTSYDQEMYIDSDDPSSKWHWFPGKSTNQVTAGQMLSVEHLNHPHVEQLQNGVLMSSRVPNPSQQVNSRSLFPHARLGPASRRPQKSGLKTLLKVNPLSNNNE